MILSLFLLSLFSWSASFAQTIRGKVIDAATREALPFAHVVLLQVADSSFVSGTVAGEDGVFSLDSPADPSLVRVSLVGYETRVMPLRAEDIRLIALMPGQRRLGEVTVQASAVVREKDRQLVYPSKEQVERSMDGLDLTSRLALPRVWVDPNTRSISMANGNLQLRINGVQASPLEVAALPPADIKRVEYHDNPGLRYGEGVDIVLDYITVKRTSGGNFGMDLNHQLNTFWMSDYIYGKYNRGHSEFSLSAYANGHRYTEAWQDRTETFHGPDGTFQRTQEGLPGRDYEMYWTTTANYNYTNGEESFLNAKLNLFYYDYPHSYSDALLRNSASTAVASLTDNSKSRNFRPSLDVYYFRKLERRQSLAFNVVGTYSTTDSRHTYQETLEGVPVTDIYTRVDGKRYSVIGEGIYEKETESGRFSAGLKHTQAYTDNVYSGSGDYTTHMTEAESYLYGQYVGTWKKWVYNVGVGLSRSYLSQADAGSYNRWYFRPLVALTYNINRALSLRYRYELRNVNPSLSELSDVEQWIDSLQIRKGNPDLSPFLFHTNAIEFHVNTAKVKTGLTLSYQYQPDIVMEETRYDAARGIFVRTYDNQRSFHRLSPEVYLNYSPLGDYLRMNISGGLNHYWSNGNHYAHTYTDPFYAISLSSDVRNFSFGLRFYKRAFLFSGETMQEMDRFSMLSVGYKIGKVRLNASFSTDFHGSARYREENHSALAPYVTDKCFGDIFPSFQLGFSYHLDFGRKYHSGNRKLYNSDNESGILDNRK